jgi:hypothetical protein
MFHGRAQRTKVNRPIIVQLHPREDGHLIRQYVDLVLSLTGPKLAARGFVVFDRYCCLLVWCRPSPPFLNGLPSHPARPTQSTSPPPPASSWDAPPAVLQPLSLSSNTVQRQRPTQAWMMIDISWNDSPRRSAPISSRVHRLWVWFYVCHQLRVLVVAFLLWQHIVVGSILFDKDSWLDTIVVGLVYNMYIIYIAKYLNLE